ncbi:RelA/SpoT domain-containing protein [Caballeronia sp. AZ1_KS37]|uniref:RelA/SpoT domain-containing protein n=1 Tax=Caballeronia sp. AZ1_KS37 TaxID=2921756 RepID=UPI002027A2D9|nr:RelA/SpoT domain-containing protein [Caballeronia sp. AZ1_KS37]
MNDIARFPGGSRKRVNAAGNNVRNDAATGDDLGVIEEWRAGHRHVLNTFQAALRKRTRGTNITVAQRHKRKNTIFGKLKRLQGMQLGRMDDVAGCRVIFRSLDELHEFRRGFHEARFNHKLRNDPDKYNYIHHPKATGYRGIHDVYEYNVDSLKYGHLSGLYIEIQYRTLVQHAWATAVEVIGFVTESQPKFQQGDKRYEHAMCLASEILARAHEGLKGPFPEKTDREVVEEFLTLDKEISLLQMLRGLHQAHGEISGDKNSILIFSESGSLEVKTFRDATEALRALFDLEKQMPDRDIVLVRADSSDEVRLAFKNYFSDTRDFIRLIEDGCQRISVPEYEGPPLVIGPVESTGGGF